jgi:putative SOS response-associated peptidase YedK
MCGRFTLRTPTPVLVRTFRLHAAPELTPRYNIAPTQQVAVVRHRSDSTSRELVPMHWGLIPSWAKDPSIGGRLINARCETAATKPSFRAAFRRRRCLIAADGYYEWKKVGRQKQPYYIRLRDERPFGMAGLWEAWRGSGESDPALLSCTVLTTDANSLTRDLHDRMPVILPEHDWDLWLDSTCEDPAEVAPLLGPYDSGEMQLQPVSRYVNNARHEGPECVAAERELF